MSKNESIYKYLNIAKIESEVSLSKEKDVPLTVVKFKYEVDLGNVFLFKEVFKKIYTFLNFPLLVYAESDSFLLFLKGYKLHKSIVLFKKIQNKIFYEHNVRINNVGISELDDKDSANDLLNRVHRYFVMSKRVTKSKIIYGTREFDFFDSEKREESLKVILSKFPNVQIYNLYKGIPVKEEGIVVGYDNDVICLQTTPNRIKYLQKNEKFLYIKHNDFPNIIKAEIFKYDVKRSIVCVKNIEFQDDSPVNRENIRVTPPKAVKAMVEYDGNIVANGEIKSISIDSISIEVNASKVELFKKNKNKEFVVRFRLFAKNSMMADNIALKATFYNAMGNDIIFLTKPDAISKTKIAGYINTIKEDIVKNLRVQNRI